MSMEQPLSAALIAGASAGVAEHIVMYPVDTIRTRLQVSGSLGMPKYTGIIEAFQTIRVSEGAARLYRGIPVVISAAVPSHAAYFSVLEITRGVLSRGSDRAENKPLINAAAGIAATVAHDTIVTPMDVVKQRMQVHGSKHVGSIACFRSIIRQEGIGALYASYPTTLVMNIPFMALFVSTYESLKHWMARSDTLHGTPQHLLAAAGAGAVAGYVTTPLDVIKTRIQVYGLNGSGVTHATWNASLGLWRDLGWRAFLQGGSARAFYFMPSAAICWSTYEMAKTFFGIEIDESLEDMLPI